ncbi:hypothetical protein ACIPNL_05535 [Curtobacterium sp. NPDC090221]|uniref:hypothetical protein n=1 Tax=Curtobacterium sp. NPDC090221 TaxID=3363971 RepID=UPI0038256AE9
MRVQALLQEGLSSAIDSPKTHKRRSVVFPAFLHAGLAASIEGKSRDELFFADAHGQHLRRTRVSTGSRSWFKTALTTVASNR